MNRVFTLIELLLMGTVMLAAMPATSLAALFYSEWLITYEQGNYPTDYCGWQQTNTPPEYIWDSNPPGIANVIFNNDAGASIRWGTTHKAYIGYPAGPKFNLGVRARTYAGKWGTNNQNWYNWIEYNEGQDGMLNNLGYLRTPYPFQLEWGIEDQLHLKAGRGAVGWKTDITIAVENSDGWHSYAVEVDMTTGKAHVYFDGVLVGNINGYDCSTDPGYEFATSSFYWGSYVGTSAQKRVDYDDFWLVDAPVLMKGDVNSDSWVGEADLLIVTANRGKARPTRDEGDLNGDGLVDDLDQDEVLVHWDRGYNPGGAGLAAEQTAQPVTGVYPAAGAASLSRGHQTLLQWGLQIQPHTCPQLWTQDFDVARWTEGNYTAVDFGSGPTYPVDFMPAPPGLPWSNLTFYTGHLDPVEEPYASMLIRLCIQDEQDITNPSELAALVGVITSLHNLYPHVIVHTNQGGRKHSPAEMRHYMQTVQPDMLMFDTYPFTGHLTGGSPAALYRDLEKYRKLGLEGNDGTGTQPIPVAVYTQTFKDPGRNNHIVSESEIRLNSFAAWAFGCKLVDNFFYDARPDEYHTAILFDGPGTANPTPAFYQTAETNRQSLNLGPALVRLVSTDARMIMGRHRFLSYNLGNPLPDGVSAWDPSAGPYITTIYATNSGTRNDSLEGDIIVGYFKPLAPEFTNPGHENDVYFMILNGLSDELGSASDCRQQIRLDFNFVDSGITNLLRLSRQTGSVEEVALIHDGGSLYHLDLLLDGGTGDLFKFNNGGAFVFTTTVQGTVYFGNYSGDPQGVGVTVELRPVGGGEVRTERMLLDADNQFTISDVRPGTYDIAMRAYPFLQKVLTEKTVGTTETLVLDPVTLTAGDLDGDNEITSMDLSIVLANK